MVDLQGRRVLVVEDEAMIRFVMADEFEHAGCQVREAADGYEAIAALETDERFDLMVTDIRMPGFDGWTLAERARAMRPHLPVLYVTGFSHIDPRPVPGGEMLLKPFSPTQLLAVASRLFA
jgi:CheY-like chemotaxis protein